MGFFFFFSVTAVKPVIIFIKLQTEPTYTTVRKVEICRKQQMAEPWVLRYNTSAVSLFDSFRECKMIAWAADGGGGVSLPWKPRRRAVFDFPGWASFK